MHSLKWRKYHIIICYLLIYLFIYLFIYLSFHLFSLFVYLLPYALDFVQFIYYIFFLLYLDNVHALIGDYHSFQMRANDILFYFVRL